MPRLNRSYVPPQESLQWLEKCAQNRRYFDHENICTLLGVTYSAYLGPLLVLEYYTGGNLIEACVICFFCLQDLIVHDYPVYACERGSIEPGE